ncbi:hypothetical protein RAMLITH_19885 [Ramlibacter sp. RBP-2]|uniref:DUF4124 domain-containing protein n=1 Tax=Ramlibacter lithotrophicus TaxID=2606681 RepID=A0A7X6DJ56_9BURK|nr:hypothetical protein [Ramlibacter lithotrophicus]NKE68089.1 hypothetical protein [Ramlibacter lithotrophicus]
MKVIAGLPARRLPGAVAAILAGACLAAALVTAGALAAPVAAKSTYKCAAGARQFIVAARSVQEAKAAARSGAAGAPGASRISCKALRSPPAQVGSVQPPAAQPADGREARQSHRWRGHPVPGQELLPGETPEECITRLHIPRDDKLEALCRPIEAKPASR